jgi:arsenite-transporting ATPase
MRLILYTGKGGVGKSSVAAATAVHAAASGRRTLLVSSDTAHNLSDIFACPVGGQVVRELAAGLAALEIDALQEIRDNWSPARDYFAQVLAGLGLEDPVAEEISLLPGMDELFLLTRILRELESDRYDLVIVDCSPTASTIRLLTLSDTAYTKLHKIGEMKRRFMRLARPLATRIRGVRHFVPPDDLFDVFDVVFREVSRLGEILKDPDVSSVRLVLNPDRVAIAETRRAFTYLGLFGFPVDGVFVNKVLPAELAEGYLGRWYGLQRRLIESIDQSFLDIRRFYVPLLGRQPIGLEALAALGREIFGTEGPDAVLSPSRPVSLERVDQTYRLRFSLPQVTRSEMDIGRKDNELVLNAGGYSRVFSLPDTLADREVSEARFADGTLIVTFA